MSPIALLLVLLPLHPQAEPERAGPAVRAERWVIRRTDGRVHRGPARATAEGFEIVASPPGGAARPDATGSGRETLSRRDVAQAVLERDLLAELDSRRKDAGTGPVERVTLARWALEKSLLPESVTELDAVLAADPDFFAARELVAQAPLALTLPGGPRRPERSLSARLVLFGARAKPAFRELAAARLAGEPRQEAQDELARAFALSSASVRAFAAFGLRRLGAEGSTGALGGALVRRAVVDPSDRVRLEAARALRDAREESLAGRVAAALSLDDATLRTFAAQSLGEMGYRSAVPAIAARLKALQSGGHPGGVRAHILVGNQVAYVQDFDPEIAQGTSIGDPVLGVVDDATVLDVRVGGISTQHGPSARDEGRALCRSLARLTGEKLPEEPAAWLSWWESNAARFAEKRAAPTTGG